MNPMATILGRAGLALLLPRAPESALCSSRGTAQGESVLTSRLLKSNKRGRSGPCQSLQPVGAWR